MKQYLIDENTLRDFIAQTLYIEHVIGFYEKDVLEEFTDTADIIINRHFVPYNANNFEDDLK